MGCLRLADKARHLPFAVRESGGGRFIEMGVLETILIIIEALVSVALIVVVLMQSGKKAGLSGAIAGGSETYMSKGKSSSLDQKLADSTKWIALVWVILTLALSLV